MKRILPLLLFCFLASGLSAQCMLYPVSLTERVKASKAIVEGEIVSRKSYWDEAHTNIYTLNRIRPVKVFNWDFSASYTQDFYIITEGGIVGNLRQHVTATLELNVGDIGVFMGIPTKTILDGSDIDNQLLVLEAYAGPQGFIHFDDNQQYAHDPFNNYVVAPELYNKIAAITGKGFTEVNEYEIPGATINVAPTITSFGPDSLTAGTKSVLTIEGTSFGSTRGSSKVRFKDANNGGSGFFDPEDVEYISWSDTLIEVEVPRRAGTGKFTVDNGSGTVQSATNLTISFAMLNVVDNSNDVFQPKHIGENGTGYTWQFFTDFDNNANAKQSFLRAFQNWRCGTLINWDIGTTSTINTIARDGTNIIRFDVGSELPNGVLGRCSSWWSGCSGGGNTFWYVAELDIVFDDGINWNYGPGNPSGSQYDFESVAVHELGHGHQLGHVIKSTEIMHYSIANGQKKRVLSADGDLNGGNYVMDFNLKGGVCNKNVMIALNPTFCSLIPVAGFSPSQTVACPNQTITFTDTSGGSTNSFTWDFGADATPATAIGKGPHTVSYSSSGKKTVVLIVGGVIGNDTSDKVDLIEVEPDKPVMPTIILGSDTACVGAQQYDINPVADATTYVWGVNGSGTVNQTNDTFAMASFTATAGSVALWVKASNSCGSSDSVLKTVPVIDKPSADYTFTIQGDTILLNNASQDEYANLWKFPDGQTSAAQNLLFTPAQSGTYDVKLLATNACGTDSVVKSITFIRVGVNEVLNKIGFSIYPNPFSTTATIKIEQATMYSNLVFEMFDMAGRKVTTKLLVNAETTLNKGDVANGVYMYKVTNGSETLATGRLVVQ